MIIYLTKHRVNMEPEAASKATHDEDEQQDLQDDQVLEALESEITKDIQADPPPKAKKERTPKQQEAFKKAREALAAK